MKKKKKIKFDEVKVGECFKYHGTACRKKDTYEAFPLTKKSNLLDRFFFGEENVIPVTVTIKVKEK